MSGTQWFANRDEMDLFGDQVTSIRSKKAIDLAVSLFKAIEDGAELSSINDILDEWKHRSMAGFNINKYSESQFFIPILFPLPNPKLILFKKYL